MIDEPRQERSGELSRYTRDLTAEARAGKLEPVKCRAAWRTASAVPWNQSELSGVCSAARISTKPCEKTSSR